MTENLSTSTLVWPSREPFWQSGSLIKSHSSSNCKPCFNPNAASLVAQGKNCDNLGGLGTFRNERKFHLCTMISNSQLYLFFVGISRAIFVI